MKHAGLFPKFARWIAITTGKPLSFVLAISVVAVWLISGPLFHFSDTWQLVINTGTTIVTFLMVFLIQNTQNRDSQATQLKLDELLRAVGGAHTALIDLEELTDEELNRIHGQYLELASRSRKELRKGVSDTGSPEVKP